MKILSDYLDQKDARLLQILGLIILIIAVGYALFSKGDELTIAKSLGIGSLGLATISIGIAIDSGNRMKVIANSNFIEKMR